MGFFSAIKRMMRNEIAADVSQNNGFDKLAEWWGLIRLNRSNQRDDLLTCLRSCLRRWEKCRLNFIRKMRAEEEFGHRLTMRLIC